MPTLATGRYSVLRGSSQNEYGDEVEATTSIKSGIRGSVLERTQKVFNSDSGRLETVRTYTGRFPHGTDIVNGDRVQDDKTLVTFTVTGVSVGSDFINKSDLVLELTVN